MKGNFYLLLLLLFSVAIGLGPAWAYTPPKLPPLRIIEDFSDEAIGRFPRSFKTFPFQRDRAVKVYSVETEGENRFLRALDRSDISVQIYKEFYWIKARWPILSWRWRARTLPAKADERWSSTNDSACGIYVAFGQYTGKIIKYVWSASAPAGTLVAKRPGRFEIVVKESGPAHLNEWREVTVNVVEDHRRFFGRPPEREPSGFGILTDGNATHSAAACDYDDFKIAERSLRPNP